MEFKVTEQHKRAMNYIYQKEVYPMKPKCCGKEMSNVGATTPIYYCSQCGNKRVVRYED